MHQKVPNKKVKKVPHQEHHTLPRDVSVDSTRDDISSENRGTNDAESNDTTNTASGSLPGAYAIAGLNDIPSGSLPGAYAIASLNDIPSRNSRNDDRVNFDATPIVNSTYIHNHVVEPVIFAAATPPSFLQNKSTRNRVFGFILVTSFLTIAWSILGSRYSSNPLQIIERENFILKSMNLDNIAIHIRGVVSVNNPVSILLWINATNDHIKDFYEANEDFGIIVAKIETVFLEDLFTEQEGTGVIEIRYSQVFNFYTKDNSKTAENFALTPFSTRQGKITYITSLKSMNEMYSKVNGIGDVFTFTSFPSGSPTISIEPSISTSPTDLTSLYPTLFSSHIPSISFLPTMAYSLTGWSIAVNELSSMMLDHTMAASDDLVSVALSDDVVNHVEIWERNDSGDYSLFQTIFVNSIYRDNQKIEMDKDGKVLIVNDFESYNAMYFLSVYFREDTKQTFEIQQRLDRDSIENPSGLVSSMTPNGLMLIVLSEPIYTIHMFSRDKSEDQFLLHHTITTPEEYFRQYVRQTQIAVSADGLILIVGEGHIDSTIVYVFSRNPTNEFTIDQMLEEKEKEDWFGHSLALSRSGNILAVAAPYASPKLNKEGSIHLYVRNETNKYNHYSRFDGTCNFQYLGIGGTMINSTESMLAIHTLGLTACEGGDAIVQTYILECECVNKRHVCQGFSDFPILVCDDKILYS